MPRSRHRSRQIYNSPTSSAALTWAFEQPIDLRNDWKNNKLNYISWTFNTHLKFSRPSFWFNIGKFFRSGSRKTCADTFTACPQTCNRPKITFVFHQERSSSFIFTKKSTISYWCYKRWVSEKLEVEVLWVLTNHTCEHRIHFH